MKPTDILSDEHRVIEQVLACLEKMVQRCHAEGKLDRQAAEEAVTFFRNFADRCHHAKEETHLFRAMEPKGFSREYGPTGVMLQEHELARARVSGMDQAIGAAAGGDAEAVGRFVDHARAYIELLREHIQKEDHCLFAMANQALSDSDQRRLMAAFEKAEAEQPGQGTHEEYVKIADRLADRFGVPRAVASGAGRPGCQCSG